MQQVMGNPVSMAAARGQVEEPVLPAAALAGTNSAQKTEDAPQGFALPATLPGNEAPQSVVAAVAGQWLSQDEEQAAPQEQPDPALDESTEADTAEQWLLGMLGQQQAQVQAREGRPFADHAEGDNVKRGERSPEVLTGSTRRGDAVQLQLQAQPALDAAPARNVRQSDGDAVLSALLTRTAQPAEGASQSVSTVVEQPAISALAVGSTHNATLPGMQGDTTQAAPVPAQLQQHLRLDNPQAKWGEQMLSALRDSVELQLQQKVQSATIRLDPPELGSLEILLNHDSGRLQVQISASQGDVARLLQQTSERLRQELVGQNFLQVEVQVGNGQSGQPGQQQARRAWASVEEGAVMANDLSDSAADERRSSTPNDVLITV